MLLDKKLMKAKQIAKSLQTSTQFEGEANVYGINKFEVIN